MCPTQNDNSSEQNDLSLLILMCAADLLLTLDPPHRHESSSQTVQPTNMPNNASAIPTNIPLNNPQILPQTHHPHLPFLSPRTPTHQPPPKNPSRLALTSLALPSNITCSPPFPLLLVCDLVCALALGCLLFLRSTEPPVLSAILIRQSLSRALIGGGDGLGEGGAGTGPPQGTMYPQHTTHCCVRGGVTGGMWKCAGGGMKARGGTARGPAAGGWGGKARGAFAGGGRAGGKVMGGRGGYACANLRPSQGQWLLGALRRESSWTMMLPRWTSLFRPYKRARFLWDRARMLMSSQLSQSQRFWYQVS